jgi:ubiquinone/menaquinone biosynthesis C-methylase UbiE
VSRVFTEAELSEKYAAVADRYDRVEAFTERLGVRTLRQRLLSHARGQVLEVAVGTGANFPFYPTGCVITAVDLSPAMLAHARARADTLALDVTLLEMSAEQLDFPDGQFDTVVSTMSTCTFPNPIAALREMGRVCRPGGQILLVEHGRSRWRIVGALQDWLADWQSRLVGCHWNRESLTLVQDAGLHVVHAERRLLGMLHLIRATPPDSTKRSGNQARSAS